ncbi:hypothetical protein [Kribbella sp. NPDC048915]
MEGPPPIPIVNQLYLPVELTLMTEPAVSSAVWYCSVDQSTVSVV